LDAWAVVAAGRTAQAVAPAAPARGGGGHPWTDALDRASEGTPLHALISELLNRKAAGDDAASLDAELDRSLENAAPQDLCDATRRDVTSELATFRERMNGEEFQTMLRRALVDRLRRTLSLPRLALTR
jgi:hypothetical protein